MLAPITEIFCDIDDFCNTWFVAHSQRILPNPKRIRYKECRMATSELMTILILFHLSHYRTLKDFYQCCVQPDMKSYFPKQVSYNRFVELISTCFLPLTAYLMTRLGKPTGLYYIDSSALKVCHNRRINRHRVFDGIATRGKTSVDWFFGFKLHLVVNHVGELVNFCVTRGHVADSQPMEQLFRDLQGLAAGDKGYISKDKADRLEQKGLRLLTRVRRNMKEKVMTGFEKCLLAQRSIIETIIDQLKALCQIEHSRHRKPDNFLVNLVSGLMAYMLRPRKPAIRMPRKFSKMAFLMSS